MTNLEFEDVEVLASQEFLPVIVGSDLGAFGLARSFYEEWGIRPVIVARTVLGPIKDTRIAQILTVKTAESEAVLGSAALGSADPALPAHEEAAEEDRANAAIIDYLLSFGEFMASREPEVQPILIANSDTYIIEIQKRAAELSRWYSWASPSLEQIEITNSKQGFFDLAKQYDLPVPETLELNLDDGVERALEAVATADFPFPLIVKASQSYGYEHLSWPGKAKVYTASDAVHLRAILTDLEAHTAGVPEARRFVVQPRVSGNDTFNLSITAYVDRHGKVTFLGGAHVLLEDHMPTALGNPAAMITERYSGIYADVVRFLEGVGWHGFGNFDLKIDSKTGRPYFFEINPRIGRNLYYNTAAGNNPMRAFVADMLGGNLQLDAGVPEKILYSVVPRSLLLTYTRGEVRKEVLSLIMQNRFVNPFLAPGDRELSVRYVRRRLYVLAHTLNHWRKFLKYYPPSAFKTLSVESFATVEIRD